MAAKQGLLAKLSQAVGRIVLRREMVGSDLHGNYYYR